MGCAACARRREVIMKFLSGLSTKWFFGGGLFFGLLFGSFVGYKFGFISGKRVGAIEYAARVSEARRVETERVVRDVNDAARRAGDAVRGRDVDEVERLLCEQGALSGDVCDD